MAIVASELVGAIAGVSSWQPPAGRFEPDGPDLLFVPRFPFLQGTRYSLLVQGVEMASILCPEPRRTRSARVCAIYPGARELPVNQLKLYIQFSEPMSEGFANDAIQVTRADTDEPLAGVLVTSEPELWDRRHRRLTLLLDPGRIKRGLAPNLEAGYPLVEGRAVNVIVRKSFRDALGQPLHAGAQRRYEVGQPVRTRVDPLAWRLRPPRAGTTDPLTVEFDRPLDHALLTHCLEPHEPDGTRIPGHASIGNGEWSWRFTPSSPWSEGTFVLGIDARLEDLAGNSLRRVFDRDLTQPTDRPLDIDHAELAVRVA
jgi:hypothetical protein